MLRYKKRTTKVRTHHPISPFEHYTVFIALMISMITTFLLGILLTEVLFGSGLNYFAEMKRQASVQRTYAAPRAIITPRTLTAQPPVFDRGCCANPTGCYNDCLDVYGAAGTCQKRCSTLQPQGQVNFCNKQCIMQLESCMERVNDGIKQCVTSIEPNSIEPAVE